MTKITIGNKEFEVSNSHAELISKGLEIGYEAQKKDKPETNHSYLYINEHMRQAIAYFESSDIDRSRIEQKNCFWGPEKVYKAEMARLRKESIANAWIPEEGEEFYYWGFHANRSIWGSANKIFIAGIFIGSCHKTKEECEAWGKKYSEAFLDIFN